MSDAPETPASRGMDPTVKGILAATIGLSALGGLLIAAVDQLDVPPPEVSTGDGGDRPEDSLEAERAREVASRLERARVLLGEGRFARRRRARCLCAVPQGASHALDSGVAQSD